MKVHKDNQSNHTTTQAKSNKIVLKSKEQLYRIIVDKQERPNCVAINLYWDEYRSWHNTKEIIDNSGNVIRLKKLYQPGIRTSNKYLANKYNCSVATIRRANKCLEDLELISRHFVNKLDFQVPSFNQLNIFVWKDTPHFFNPFGIYRSEVKTIKPPTNHKNNTLQEDTIAPISDHIVQSSVSAPPLTHERTNILRPELRELNSFPKEREFSSFPKIKNKRVKSKQSNALPCHPDRAASHSDCFTQEHKDETMKAYNWDDPAKKLDLEISRNFDTQMATMLTTDVDYLHIPQRNTLQLVLKKKLTISEQDKNRLKQLIKNIYGDAILIASVPLYAKKTNVVKISQVQENFTNNTVKPANNNLSNASQTYQKIITNLELAHGSERIKAWFGNVKFIETEKSIVFDTSDAAVDYITNNFTSALKQSSKELGMPLQFIGKSKVQAGRMYNVEITEDGKYNINHQLAE